MKILVLSNPAASHLKVLEQLPDSVTVTVAHDPDFAVKAAADADVILNAMWSGDLLRLVFPHAERVRWIHNLSAGVELALFPELIDSPVPLTNGRGVFAESLAEFVMASALFFAKDLRRMVGNQEAGRWETFDVEMLAGRTMGIVGYGEIGRASGKLAQAFGMGILALRRRAPNNNNGVETFTPDRIRDLVAESDYLTVAAPLTLETRGLVGLDVIAAMKPSAVVINVGRGPVIDEAALIDALRNNRIRGAALDVFDTEPLPPGHPFYSLPNVLLSPHTADHTVGWVDLAMRMFVRNFERFAAGQPLENVVDKKAGY